MTRLMFTPASAACYFGSRQLVLNKCQMPHGMTS
jgi:hypothetical protein